MGPKNLGQSMTAREIFELVHDDLQKVEREIARESTASVAAVTNIGRYLQSSGGKRLRPMLLLLTAKLMGKTDDLAVRLAAVVEMIHTATLVHDDVIDVAETRRGKPSTNIIWGNHTCVLAGDWLYMQAFQVALRLRNFQFLDILIALTQLMVEGELIQLERIGKIDVTETEYEELVDRKTASLFSACARLGALAGGAGETAESHLAEYGWHLGMAFQLVDDVLDFTSREAVLGKPVGNDLREGKVTLPLIYALEEAGSEERRLVETVLRDNSYERVSFRKVLDIVQDHNGIERALRRAQSFTEQARTIISSFPGSPAQRALAAVIELVIERDH
jgi:octaprenyl-diphosphate synthase